MRRGRKRRAVALAGCMLIATPGTVGTAAAKRESEPCVRFGRRDTVAVTASATKAKPVEFRVAAAPAGGRATVFLQVYSPTPAASFSASATFTPLWSYTLETLDARGEQRKASSAPASGSVELAGVATKDCEGHFLALVSDVTPGEKVTIRLWLDR